MLVAVRENGGGRFFENSLAPFGSVVQLEFNGRAVPCNNSKIILCGIIFPGWY